MKFIFLIILLLFKYVANMPVYEVELNDEWTLENENGTIKIEDLSIPSGIFSAYAKSLGLPEDEILYSKNDIHWRWLAHDNWTYTKRFLVSKKNEIKFINLVFYGIDTISTITLNDHEIGRTDNMFVRYTFEVGQNGVLQDGQNILKIKIKSPILEAKERAQKYPFTPPKCPPAGYNGECQMNMLRKMQASFGWDWGLAAPSMGIWQRVTLEYYDIAVIREVDATTTQLENGKWNLSITIYLETKMNEKYYGELTFYGVELLKEPKKFVFGELEPITNSVIKFDVIIEKNDVELWWPNGLGNQKLYHLHFTFNGWRTPDGSDPRNLTLTQKSIRIGFRKIELIEDKLENGLSFYFKVNGHPVFMKGTNFIPSHILPELGQNQERIRHLLASVKEANMNMIRVWGGGVYESNFFYDMADNYGILVWQDMMFGCAMYPVIPEFLDSIRTEVVQNIKRIGHHASIAIIAGNNENEAALVQNWYGTAVDQTRFKSEYRLLYNATINDELRKFYYHPSRPEPLTSSPSNGKKTKEDDYISSQPQDPNYGDIHFYEYFADWSNPKIYPIPRFSSEYGFQSLPSKSAWNKIMGKHDNLKELLEHRQHLPGGSDIIPTTIFHQLPLIPRDKLDYEENIIYFSQIVQALATKIETEVYRKNKDTKYKTMGAMYWQLNDVWIAPSWSSIDFNGNFKILHYWAKEFMKPISIIAHFENSTNNVEVTVVRDTIDPINLKLHIVQNTYMYKRLSPAKKSFVTPIEISPNSALLAHTFKLEPNLDPREYFYEILLKDYTQNEVIAKTYYFPRPIKTGIGIQNPNIEIEIYSSTYKEPITSISIAIKIECPTLFVYLEVIHDDIIKYKLSDNGFIQIQPIKVVHLEFNGETKIKAEHIKVYTVNQYMNENYPTVENNAPVL